MTALEDIQILRNRESCIPLALALTPTDHATKTVHFGRHIKLMVSTSHHEKLVLRDVNLVLGRDSSLVTVCASPEKDPLMVGPFKTAPYLLPYELGPTCQTVFNSAIQGQTLHYILSVPLQNLIHGHLGISNRRLRGPAPGLCLKSCLTLYNFGTNNLF
jgi:hypothetical protein